MLFFIVVEFELIICIHFNLYLVRATHTNPANSLHKSTHT